MTVDRGPGGAAGINGLDVIATYGYRVTVCNGQRSDSAQVESDRA
jgi:hypothetical protein